MPRPVPGPGVAVGAWRREHSERWCGCTRDHGDTGHAPRGGGRGGARVRGCRSASGGRVGPVRAGGLRCPSGRRRADARRRRQRSCAPVSRALESGYQQEHGEATSRIKANSLNRDIGKQHKDVHRKRFLWLIAPAAPWVFGSISLAIVTLPGLVERGVDSWSAAYTGLLTALTFVVGLCVQPLGRRLHHRGSARGFVGAQLVTALAMVPAVFTAREHSPLLMLVAVSLLGAGYGLGVMAGLLEMQHIGEPGGLTQATGAYYSLAYLGFLLPLGLAASVQSAHISYPGIFAVLAFVLLAQAGWSAFSSRRWPSPATGIECLASRSTTRG
ncbi:MFS transporter [Streptomyces kanamyceticus]|uniref:MFS transporter n=1 Tax=Streptomyces kanamyceticus TaxID=1967 RepID=A0A5J6GTM8_STRKN|nr:MFS transporter [Streptomyces kanamyceticus]